MKREYTTGTAEAITFFVGDEIERTPAYGMPTLFVVGVHEPEVILNLITEYNSKCELIPNNITHIYFGANQSFKPNGTNDVDTWRPWEDMIHVCLEAGYWCTLDLDVKDVEGLLESGLTEKRRFIPQISVKIPYLTQLGYNATIKIDDVDFAATNPGVWCHRLHNLLDETKFTDWDQYGKDEIIR
jgi:hypothetical protein